MVKDTRTAFGQMDDNRRKLTKEVRAQMTRIALLEKALQEIIELPSVRQDECCNIALAAMDNE
jgi:hypothetical protein